MTDKRRYCSRCAQPLEQKLLEDRWREVCSTCGFVHYRNPLPVASAVVLNEDREVLLVKRANQPYKGMWCLPIGFAELDETIEQAALRELAEEAGVVGRVVRLLDASSMVSESYGDILVVAFEVEATRTTAKAGDDAEDVGWFPVEALPALAFEPNETAISRCLEAHREQWAIQDSFSRLDGEGAQEFLSDVLVGLIREHAEEITEQWLLDVVNNPTTRSYGNVQKQLLRDRAKLALSQFERWLSGREAEADVREFYRSLGAERKADGVELVDVISSLSLFRKHIWAFAHNRGMWERPIEVYRVLELDRRFVVFFDKAIYHTVRGYTDLSCNESRGEATT